MPTIEVFADVTCPFAHVGLRRYVAERDALGRDQPRLRVRAWPLELVNGRPLDGPGLAGKIAALREGVAPGRFAGFDPDHFPSTSLGALAAEAAAYRAGPAEGEAFSLAIRDALFERGLDIGDPGVVARLVADAGFPPVTGADLDAVGHDHAAGVARGVLGSPHFFLPDGRDFFCPSLRIAHHASGIDVDLDRQGLEQFLAAALG